jgi:hypothetical protein
MAKLSDNDSAAVSVKELPAAALPEETVRALKRLAAVPGYVQAKAECALFPDYYRCSGSHEADAGAPVVVLDAPAGLAGRCDRMVLAGGKRLSVQYVVLEAGSVLMPYCEDDTPNAAYFAAPLDAPRAVLGIGALAGLEKAYQREDAESYLDDLKEDISSYGLTLRALKKLKYPVLVRAVSSSDLPEILEVYAAEPKTASQIAFDEALEDARRIAFVSIPLDDAGQPTEAALNAFIAAQPLHSQAELVDTDNAAANLLCETRLANALFAEAYTDVLPDGQPLGAELTEEPAGDLFRIRTESRQSEDKAALAVLYYAAPLLREVKGLPAGIDIRPIVIKAAYEVMRSKAAADPKTKPAVQPEAQDEAKASAVLAKLMLANKRSPKKAGEAVVRVTRALLAEAAHTEGVLFPTDEWSVARSEDEDALGTQLEFLFDEEPVRASEAEAKWETRRGAALFRALTEGGAEEGELGRFLRDEKEPAPKKRRTSRSRGTPCTSSAAGSKRSAACKPQALALLQKD